MGEVFGKWTVIADAGMKGASKFWECMCGCGTRRLIATSALRGGKTTQCKACHLKQFEKKSNDTPLVETSP